MAESNFKIRSHPADRKNLAFDVRWINPSLICSPGESALLTPEVTGEVRRLLAALQQPMKRTEIQASLGLKHKDHFRAAYLVPALIERTIPDKTNSRLQKYRLTAKGHAQIS